MSYVLIEFEGDEDEGSVAIVRKSWLSPRKRNVFWPPITNQKAFNRTLQSKTREDEVISNWKIYPIAKCLYETDDLDKAKKKLKLSEVTSDLQTDDQSEEQVYKRRKVVTPRRFISSSEEESDLNDLRPPQLKNKFRRILADTHDSKNEEAASYLKKQSNTNSQQNSDKSISGEIIHMKDSSFAGQNILLNTFITDNNLNNTPPSCIHSRNRERNGNLLNSTDVSHESVVVNLLSYIKAQNAQILALLQSKEGKVLREFPFTFPMKSIEDVHALEKVLEDQKQVDSLTSYLTTLGGRDISSKVSRILKHLLLDSLAATFSFYGKRSNKRPFSELRTKTAVLNSVKETCLESTDKDIEDSIKIWLKHAPDREKMKIKRTVNQNQSLQN